MPFSLPWALPRVSSRVVVSSLMRIISGTAKGRRLFTPKSQAIRPASDKVKGAIFNILGDISGTYVLDLFAGTGSVGLEAASRGAASVSLVDDGRESLGLLKKNIEQTQLQNNCQIIRGHIPTVLSKIKKPIPQFDLIFVDPPYDKNLIFPALDSLLFNKLIDDETLVIIEHSPREKPEHPKLSLVDERKYGQTLISFLKKK